MTKATYTTMLMEGKLNSYLAEIDKQAEERRLIFNALLSLRNKLIAQGRYTDAVDELMIKIQKQHRNAAIRKTEWIRYKHPAPQSTGSENGLNKGFFSLKMSTLQGKGEDTF